MKINLLDLPLHILISLWLYQAIQRKQSKQNSAAIAGDPANAVWNMMEEIKKIIDVPTHTASNFLERYIHNYFWQLYNAYSLLKAFNISFTGFIRRDDDNGRS